jgi:glycosyltransferase involved in cell wall biosynthesis
MTQIRVSVITVSFNCAGTISDTIESVLSQSYPYIEHIIIDGGSTDGTTEIVKSFGNRIAKFISDPDEGIYDALNKGIKIATGDIVGILHSDDFFCNENIIRDVAAAFTDNETDAVFGDIQFVDQQDTAKVVRYYSSKNFRLSKFRFGYMPAHPSFYVRRSLFEKLGYYKTDYKIAADYELTLRFLLINRIRYVYLNHPFVSMRTGGVSNKSFASNITLNREIAKACKENGVYTNYLLIYLKYFTKIFEFSGRRISRTAKS